MKRLAILAIALWPALAFGATTYYVDPGCTFNGSGSVRTPCASGNGNSGPANSIDNGIGLLSTPGDVLNIRGPHTAHDTCAGITGIYTGDEFRIQGKSGQSGNPIVIQGDPGDTTHAVISGIGSVPGSWTQCSDCSAGSAQTACRNVPGTCGDAWFATGSGNQLKALFSEKSDGVPTYWVSVIDANFNNSHAGFVSTTCAAPYGWIQCNTASDCPGAVACSGSTSEIDAFSQETNSGTLTVRWAGATKGGVVFDNNGYGFSVCNSSWITIRNLSFRNHRRNAVLVADTGNGGCATAPTHIVVDNIVAAYTLDIGGSGHDVGVDHVPSITVTNSYFAYDTDESFHSDAACTAVSCTGAGAPCACCTGAGAGATCTGATALTYQGNFSRDHGDGNAFGPAHSNGTASGMIISGSHSNGMNGSGDYTGSDVSNNYFLRCRSHGILLENTCSNLALHDNVFKDTGRASIRGACDNSDVGSGVSGNSIYNNLIIGGNTKNTGAASIDFEQSNANCSIKNNLIYNNTCVDPTNGGLEIAFTEATAGSTTGNKLRNNLLSTTLGQKLVNFVPTDATNALENALINTTASPAITWLNADYTNANITSGCSGHCSGSLIGDPLFANVPNKDYHIQTASPAKDAGTSTGMPAARTRDINNTIAGAHGLPPYNDNQALFGTAWDIGADEFSTGVAPNLKVSKTHTPDPVVGGNNLTYTIQYSNAGATQTTSTVISDTIPTNTTFVSATNGGTSNGTTVTWSIGVLAGGGSGSVQWVARVATGLSNGTIISNASSITSTEQGPVNATVDTATVTALPFLTLAKSDQPDPVLAGSNITYTIAYANTGTGGATNVVITDVIPVNTAFVSATSGGTLSGSTVTWNIGAVNAGVNASVQLVVAVGGGVAAGSVITNSTYSLASNELPTVTGAPIGTTVITSSPTSTNFVLPITQRQNSWTATQTDLFLPNADLVQGPNGAQWIRGQATEEVTLSTSGTTTDSSTNLLPANAFIEAVVARVTVTITVASNWKLGDSSQAARFTAAISGLAAGTTTVGLNHLDPTVASANLGPVQTSATPVRITTTGTPGAGKIRITVFYRQYIPPGS